MRCWSAPTLFESGADSLCDCTVSVISNDPLRIKRIMERDNIEEAMAISRLRSQYPNEFYIQRSDYIIKNYWHSYCNETANTRADIGAPKPL